MLLENRRIEINVGRTINLGNYESKRIDISLGGDIQDDDTLKSAIDDIYNLLEDELTRRIGD